MCDCIGNGARVLVYLLRLCDCLCLFVCVGQKMMTFTKKSLGNTISTCYSWRFRCNDDRHENWYGFGANKMVLKIIIKKSNKIKRCLFYLCTQNVFGTQGRLASFVFVLAENYVFLMFSHTNPYKTFEK